MPPTTASAINLPSSISQFHFQTIGQAPALLQRMTGSTNEIEMASRSPSPDLENELLVPSPDHNPSSQPSLQSRLAMNTPSTSGNQSLSAQNTGPLSQAKNVQHASAMDSSVRSERQNVKTAGSATIGSNSASNAQAKVGASDASSSSHVPIMNGGAPSQTGSSQVANAQTGDVALRRPVSIVDNAPHNVVASVDSLKAIQSRLVSVVENLIPIDTSTALTLARSIKEKCSEVHTSARDAHTHASSALRSAETSMDSASRCLEVASSVQSHADDFIKAIECLSQTQGQPGCDWNGVLDALKQDLGSLAQWTREREAADAQLREVYQRAKMKAARISATQDDADAPKARQKTAIAEATTPIQQQEEAVPSPPMDVDQHPDLDSAAREYQRLLEENELIRKADEEELRRRREEEAILEQKRAQALAEAEAQKAELIRKQAERAEIEQKIQRKRMREQELAEKLRLQQQHSREKASEEKAVQEAQAERAAQVQAEKERQIRLKVEQEIAQALQKRLLEEEEERMRKLKAEQDARRAQIAELKRQSAAETAKGIQATRLQKSQDLQSSISPLSTSDNQIENPAMGKAQPSTVSVATPLQSAVATESSSTSKNRNSLENVTSQSGPKAASSMMDQRGVDSTTYKTSEISKIVPTHGSLPISSSLSAVAGIGNVMGNTARAGRLPSIPVTSSDKNPTASQGTQSKPLSSQQQRVSALPPAPATQPGMSVLSRGRDTGNVTLLDSSQILPVSPEVQRANLRHVLPNAIPHDTLSTAAPISKQESSNAEPTIKTDRSVVGTASLATLNPGPAENRTLKPGHGLPIKPKVEPVDDLPLSQQAVPMAKASVAQTQKSEKVAPSYPPKRPCPASSEQLSDRGLARKNGQVVVPDSQLPKESLTVVPGYQVRQNGQPNSLKSLPLRPVNQPTKAHEARTNGAAVNNYLNEDDGMANDPSLPSGWDQPNDDEDEAIQRRSEERIHPYGSNPSSSSSLPPPLHSLPPVPGLPAHPSLPPPPQSANRNTLPRARRGRRVDHYSPRRRTPSPRRFSPPPRRSPPRRLPSSPPPSSHYRYSRGSPDRDRHSSHSRGSVSANNSRAASPVSRPRNVPRDYRRSASPAPVPTIGRKRSRDDADNAGPPNRRLRQQGNDAVQPVYGPSRPQRASLGRPEDDWSHAAEYGRSPPLNHPAQDGSSHSRVEDRPINLPPIPGPSHSGGKSYNHNKPAARRQGGDDDSGTPELLNRISDGGNLAADVMHYTPNRGLPPRHRGAKQPGRAQHARDNRNKAQLIDRLQVQPDARH
ncbi:hypothetical protein D9613_000502 [Agrocybe pediades]|uniref:Uncharacterized protein n=1 Tax=Agrocybe pediades TaxID=84607 RepID=A0A8H4R287_9AGAR|nr:hypothetical protein D9613_000502 [Agrocybe pediades]